jgi:hypothetical protein
MKLRLMASFLLVALMFTLVSSVTAQSYSFNVDQETVNVYWNSDGTVAVDYLFNFINDSGAHVIDFVDVGMPNGSFDSGSISADRNGSSLAISSDFQGEGSDGFAVDMGAYAIQPGQSGSVHVSVGSIRKMVYPDDSEPDTYASSEFSPTYWTTAHGGTNLTVIFHLPPGVQPDEPRYHPATGGWPCTTEPTTAYDNENRIIYTWACTSARANTQYTFGISFPKQYVPADVIVTAPTNAFNVGGIITWFFSSISTWGFICCFGLIFVGAPLMGVINERKRKLQYMSPKISIEGHGIKRGLTAVESAILMEQPLDKIMTMILFGVVKKNAAEVTKREPLELRLVKPEPEDLHEYEKDFMTAFSKPNLADRRKDLQEMTVKLVKSVGDKMKGFSRRETVDYYKAIMERAWQQIETAGTPEVKSQMYDEALEWTMLGKNYDDRTRRVFTGPVIVPMWWGNYDPGYRPASTGGATPKMSVPGTSGGGRVSVPGSAFAASVVTSVQGFSSRVLGDVKTFTSGVTNRTNPVPKSTSSGGWKSSGGGGGGHSCACACACAGCACACAGGGR